MQEDITGPEAPPAGEAVPDGQAAALTPAPVRAGRGRTIGISALVGAVGVGALVLAFAAGGSRPAASPAGDGSALAPVPVGAVSGWQAPEAGSGGTQLDHPGRGRMRGAIGNAITITGIDGTKLALKTENGWTRTIDAAGATVTKDGSTAALSTLRVGDRIVFSETRNTDGTFKITAINVIQPSVAGTVASVSGSSVTVTLPDGSTSKVTLTGSTTYQLAGQAATKDAVVAGVRILARGTQATDGTLTATSVVIAPSGAAGTVKEKGASSLTLTTGDGSTVVVKVTSATTFRVRGIAAPTLADVKVGDVVVASGSRNADGSLTASVVQSRAAGQLGGPGDGFGRDFGDGFGGFGRGGGFGGPGMGSPHWPGDGTAPAASPQGTGASS